ncbi:MAG TPA: hypothetical protein VJ283_19925 [Trebonia sp.]|nr:hypothetical protein [Trebonia sp.]
MSDSDTRDQKAGGVSTMPRPAAPPRRTARPRPPAEPGRRPGLPDGVRLAPSTTSTTSTTSAHSASRGAARGGHRMPFILMLCVLLGGALVCTLLISTTLAAGSYRITKLQQSVDALARQRQTLQEQVAQAQSAQVIEQQAEQLGMTEQGQLRFFNLKTGKVQTDAGSGAVQAINVPGYTP